MRRQASHTLICTVGTSLWSNLKHLKVDSNDEYARATLVQAYKRRDWSDVAARLREIDHADWLCGAEINSVAELMKRADIEQGNLHLLVSETKDGQDVCAVLEEYFSYAGWNVRSHNICALRDDDPGAFRTSGLRNLAKIMGELVRECGIDYCAINATGGYKAQIAVAVLMGQALGLPVYYKHERFNTIISFPPMPISLDSSLWEHASGMFTVLSRPTAVEEWEQFSEIWDERFEPLVNRVQIDNVEYLELSAIGQIFHETFRTRFRTSGAKRLPRDAKLNEKTRPNLGQHNYGQARRPIEIYLKQLCDARPYIRSCKTTEWNPDLPNKNHFKLTVDKIECTEVIEGIYSNGSWCVKFRVITTAGKRDDLGAILADLNEWIIQ